MSSSSARKSAIVVGKNKISEKDWYRTLGQQISFREKIMGRKLTSDEVNNPQFRHSILQMLVNRELIAQFTKRNKLFVSDEVAVRNIVSNGLFLNDDGTVDRKKLELFLQNQNMTERDFFNIVKEEIRSGFLLSMFDGVDVDIEDVKDSLLQAYYATHNFDIFTLSPDSIKIKDAPTQTELENIYERDADLFTVPESRNISYISFGLKDVTIDDVITESQIKDYYSENIDEFFVPELRILAHIIYKNESEAQNAIASISNFTDMQRFAKDRNIDIKSDEFILGEKAYDELLPEISAIVFNSPLGIVKQPVNSALGWHVFFVKEILPEETIALKEARDTIKKAIIADRQDHEINRVAQSIDRDSISGLPLEEIAENYGFPINKITFHYDNGLTDDTSGNPLLNQLKSDAATLKEGQLSAIEYNSDNSAYFIANLTKLNTAHLQPFEIVESFLYDKWSGMQRTVLANQLFKQLTALLIELKDTPELDLPISSQALSDFLQENNIEIASDISLTPSDNHDFPMDIFGEMMAQAPGSATNIMFDRMNEKYLLAYCKEVLRPDLSAIDNDEVEKMSSNVDAMVSSVNTRVLHEEVYRYLRGLYKIKTNDAIIYKEMDLR